MPPIYEYECPSGHRFEVFFGSFHDAKPFEKSFPECRRAYCQEESAKRVVSKPLLPHLYGDPAGFHKPSPTKRHSTKLVSTKGNDSAIG